jgi:hypothetical protein
MRKYTWALFTRNTKNTKSIWNGAMIENSKDFQNMLMQSVKNSESAIGLSNFILQRNEDMQEKLLTYIIKSSKVSERLKIIDSYISEVYKDDIFMKSLIRRAISDLEDKDTIKDAVAVKDLVKTVSKISSGIKEFKGDPDLWYNLKDQLVSIKIC